MLIKALISVDNIPLVRAWNKVHNMNRDKSESRDLQKDACSPHSRGAVAEPFGGRDRLQAECDLDG